MLVCYGIERLLYLLSRSPHAENFCSKARCTSRFDRTGFTGRPAEPRNISNLNLKMMPPLPAGIFVWVFPKIYMSLGPKPRVGKEPSNFLSTFAAAVVVLCLYVWIGSLDIGIFVRRVDHHYSYLANGILSGHVSECRAVG